jgi:pSer/pThr/pTyr-binding forkhead associated (FHA) protein
MAPDHRRRSDGPSGLDGFPASISIEVTWCGPSGGQITRSFVTAFRIGRFSDCEVCVPNGFVSRYHAEVYRENAQWYIRDLGSSNGTYLDGRHVDVAPVPTEGVVQLGMEGPTLLVKRFPDVARSGTRSTIGQETSVARRKPVCSGESASTGGCFVGASCSRRGPPSQGGERLSGGNVTGSAHGPSKTTEGTRNDAARRGKKERERDSLARKRSVTLSFVVLFVILLVSVDGGRNLRFFGELRVMSPTRVTYASSSA